MKPRLYDITYRLPRGKNKHHKYIKSTSIDKATRQFKTKFKGYVIIKVRLA